MTDQHPLRTELAIWKDVRRRYPGWLVVPALNRGDLVHSSNYVHVGSLANQLGTGGPLNWPAEDRLVAWSERNWRLERALLPLPPYWASQIEYILAEIAPCQGLIEGDMAFFRPPAKDFTCRTDLRQPWIDLALALLRHHREFRQATPFQAWLDRLAPLDADWDCVHHQRAYQGALWHLTFMDDAQALVAVSRWKAERGTDPYWLARKAGLLAELGEKSLALEMWRDCRRRLQGGTDDQPHFFSKSRENSVLQALLWLQQDRPHRDQKRDQKRDQDRLRELSAIDGWSYWNELGEVRRQDLDYRERVERRKANRGSTGGEMPCLWKPERSVQCFRLAEDLGLPLRVESFSHGITSALKESFSDLALASEDLAGTSLMRLRSTAFWTQRLDPAHLAAMPEQLLADLRLACDNAWQQVEALQPPSSQAHGVIERASALLRVLVPRMGGEECRGWSIPGHSPRVSRKFRGGSVPAGRLQSSGRWD
jgi:hypothetical protein